MLWFLRNYLFSKGISNIASELAVILEWRHKKGQILISALTELFCD